MKEALNDAQRKLRRPQKIEGVGWTSAALNLVGNMIREIGKLRSGVEGARRAGTRAAIGAVARGGWQRIAAITLQLDSYYKRIEAEGIVDYRLRELTRLNGLVGEAEVAVAEASRLVIDCSKS